MPLLVSAMTSSAPSLVAPGEDNDISTLLVALPASGPAVLGIQDNSTSLSVRPGIDLSLIL